jgi:hypothetical protein
MTDDRLTPSAHAVRTETCTLWFDGVIAMGQFHQGAEVAVEHARDNMAALLSLVAPRRVPVLVDLRGIRSQSAEARAVFAGPEAVRVSNAVALLIGSPVSRVLGNFYLGFNKPVTPTRLFTTVSDARAWLLEFTDGAHA